MSQGRQAWQGERHCRWVGVRFLGGGKIFRSRVYLYCWDVPAREKGKAGVCVVHCPRFSQAVEFVFDPIRQLFCSCYTSWDTGFVLTGRGSFPVEICCLYVAVKLGPASQWERQSRGLCSWQEPSTVTWDNRGRGGGGTQFWLAWGALPVFSTCSTISFLYQIPGKEMKGCEKKEGICCMGKVWSSSCISWLPGLPEGTRVCRGDFFKLRVFSYFVSSGACSMYYLN